MAPWTREELMEYRRQYHPCENGVHVEQPEGGRFGGITIANFPGIDLTVFKELSSVDQEDTSEWDLLCDLYKDGDLHDTVGIRRQDLEVIQRHLAQEKNNG